MFAALRLEYELSFKIYIAHRNDLQSFAKHKKL